MKKSYILLIVLSTLIGSIPGFAQTTWNWSNPTPQGNTLWGNLQREDDQSLAVGSFGTIVKTAGNSVTNSFPTTRQLNDIARYKDSVWAVGDSGTILFSSNFGNSWTAQTSGNSLIALRSVYAYNKDYVFAAGDSGVILYTTNGGTTQYSRMTTQTTRQLNDITFDGTTGYAVGNNGTLIRGVNLGITGWSNLSTTRKVNYNAIAVDSEHYFVVGDSGYVMHRERITDTLIHDTTLDRRYALYDVALMNDTVIVVGANGYAARSTDLGNTWQVISLGVTNNFYSVAFAQDSSGVVYIHGERGITFKSTDFGATWMRMDSGSFDAIYALARAPQGTIFGASSNGYIFRSTNNGATWLRDSLDASLFKQTDIEIGNKFGLMSTFGASVLVTRDSGKTWSTVSIPTATTLGVTVVNDTLGFVSGALGKIYQTTDAGMTWSTTNTGVTNALYDIDAAPGGNMITAGFNGQVFYSLDYGKTWTSSNTGNTTQYNRVRFAPGSITALAVGVAGVIKKTTDGGATWTSLTSGVTSNLNDIKWFTANSAIVTGDNGVVLKTTNGGTTWTRDYIRTKENLLAALIPSANNAFVAGNYSYIFSTTNSALPVELISLTGRRVGEKEAVIEWTVAKEVNNLGYRVERNTAGAWTNAGFVNGVGTTNVSRAYSYSDRSADVAAVNYRVVQVDLNGTETVLGNVEIAPYSFVLSTNVVLYPNPTVSNSVASIELNEESPVVAGVYNTAGQNVLSLYEGTMSRGSHQIAIPASQLAAGTYMVKVQVGNEVRMTRLVINH